MTTIVVAGSIITAVSLGVRATMGLFTDAIDVSLGVGVDTFGSFGHFLLVPLTRVFIDLLGWRGSMVVLAAVTMTIAAVVLPVTPAVALGFGALLGVVWLASVPLTSGIVLGQFGLRNAGTLFGFVFLSHQVGAFAGAYGGGWVREATGSYDLWWWLAAILSIGAAAIHFRISEERAPLASAAKDVVTVFDD